MLLALISRHHILSHITEPLHPNNTTQKIADYLSISCVNVDINDLGGKILGTSNNNINQEHIIHILKDNPLGQRSQYTPIDIIRQINKI